MHRQLFISGLPRSGSTLLSAILRQNPRLHAGMSSPLYGMVIAMQRSLSRSNEYAIGIDDVTRVRVLGGLFNAYYAPFAERAVFDTNRAWTGKLDLLAELFPQTRLVCCVRPVGAIVESFEQLFRRNPLAGNGVLGFDPDMNVYARVDRLMVANGVVGQPLNALKDAFYGPHSDRLLLVSYDRLAGRPREAMKAIYDFIGEPWFDHDFERVDFAVPEFDAAFGLAGMHDVRGQVKPTAQRSTIPPDLAAMFRAPEFWTQPSDLSRALRMC